MLRERQRFHSSLIASGSVCLIVAALVLLCRFLGGLESWELNAYDDLLRLRPKIAELDSRIVLIEIDENDIRSQWHWPLTDAALVQVLQTLVQYRPRAIGVDIFRDMPVSPGYEQLSMLLKRNSNIIMVMKASDGTTDGVPPPFVLKNTEQIGFSDILVDADGTVRRGLLFLGEKGKTLYSFALRLALRYLQEEGISPQSDAVNPRALRLGSTTIRPLTENAGGYVGADTRGYQFLLDFKQAPGTFPSLSLLTLLSEKIDPEMLRDKIVLIGVNADSVKDLFHAPFTNRQSLRQEMPGVELHAHMASQLLRYALDGDAPVAVLSESFKGGWILLWSLLAGVLGYRVHSPQYFSLSLVSGLVLLGGIAYSAFLCGWWIPLIPPALAWVLSALGVLTLTVSLPVSEPPERLTRWIWNPVERERLARFIVPRAKIIEETYRTVCKNLGYTAADFHSDAAVMEWAEELYATLATRGILYDREPLTYGREQEIRQPKTIMASGLATCLETVLLYAAALERSFLSPVILLLYQIDGAKIIGAHALCGFWWGAIPAGLEALVTDEHLIRRLVQELKLIPVETIGFTIKTTDQLMPGRRQIAFDEAITVAQRQCADTSRTRIGFLLNVQRLREEHDYRPLEEGEAASL